MVEVIPAGWRVVTYASQDAPPHAAAMGRLMMRGVGAEAKKMVFHPVIFSAATEEAAHAAASKWLVDELAKARAAEEKAAVAEAKAIAKGKKPKKGAIVENIAAALGEVEEVAQAAESEEDDDTEIV